MPASPDLDLPALVVAVCARERLGEVVAAELLAGGTICRTRRLRTAGGTTLIAKQDRGCPPDFFRLEADALRAIAMGDGWRVPAVVAFDHECLVLEDLGPGDAPRRADYWEVLGRAWARLHGRLGSRFGWQCDNYYGRYRMDNAWREDGCAFYAETRLLSWLARPLVRAALDDRDRADLERIAGRLAAMMPVQPPALLHGDLWYGNLLVDDRGAPAVVDPSPHFGWPEADLHNPRMWGHFDHRFWDAYRESHPLDPGWEQRVELLYLPHLLGLIAQDYDLGMCVPWAKRLLRRFA